MQTDFSEDRRAWQAMHSQLAQEYAAQRDALALSLRDGLRDERWQALNLAWLHHWLCAHSQRALTIAADQVLHTFDPARPTTTTSASPRPCAAPLRRSPIPI